MTKTIKIDGKEIVLKTNGVVPLLYKKEFSRDFFADILELKNNDMLDYDILFNLVWVFAKIGDSNIPGLWQWLESFEAFPISEHVYTIIEMATACIATNKKLKNRSAAVKR